MPTKNVNPQSLNLNSVSREAIENLLTDLYEKFDNVRNFIDIRMTGQSDPLVKTFKKIIKNRLIGDIEDRIYILPGGQNPPEKIIRQETCLAETNNMKAPVNPFITFGSAGLERSGLDHIL